MTTTKKEQLARLENEKAKKLVKKCDRFHPPPLKLKRCDPFRRQGLNHVDHENPCSTNVMERLFVQWALLPDVMTGMSKCCRYGVPQRLNQVERDGKIEAELSSDGFVHVDFHESGRIRTRGTQKCKGLECSWCGRALRRELAENLEMALQMNAYNRGKNIFVTLTQQASSNPIVIRAASKGMAWVLSRLMKWNNKHNTNFGMFSTQETTFSKKKKLIHYRSGSSVSFGLTYHSHLHFILIAQPQDLHKLDLLMERLRDWWYAGIEKAGGVVYGTDGNLIAAKRAFAVEEWDAGRATAKYITKHLKSQELVYSETKVGRGLSLEHLKAVLYEGNSKHHKAYEKMFIDYHKALKNHSRFKSTKKIINGLIYRWKEFKDYLRTKKAFEELLGTNYSILNKLNYRQEQIIVSTAQTYEGALSKGGVSMGVDDTPIEHVRNSLEKQSSHKLLIERGFGKQLEKLGLTSGHSEQRDRSSYAKQKIEAVLDEANVLWSGNSLSIIHKIREREEELFDDGIHSYIQKPEEYEDPVVMTVSFPNKLYNWMANEGILINVLYAIRNFLLQGIHENVYKLINSIVEFTTANDGLVDEIDKKGIYKALRMGRGDVGYSGGQVSYRGLTF